MSASRCCGTWAKFEHGHLRHGAGTGGMYKPQRCSHMLMDTNFVKKWKESRQGSDGPAFDIRRACGWCRAHGERTDDVGIVPSSFDSMNAYESRSSIVGNLNRLKGHGPSSELVALARIQLELLKSMLEARIDSACGAGIRCTAYSRSATSLAESTLQLQLVACSDVAVEHDESGKTVRDEFYLGGDAAGGGEEAWVVKQPLIMLPDNGGLVLPLVHKSFLVGLLAVERVVRESSGGSRVVKEWVPISDMLGPAEINMIKQTGIMLSLSFAMDLRGELERAGSRVQQKTMQGLVDQARKPLSTLKTLGRMLQPRLPTGDPERDMTDSIVAQGDYLGDIILQLQEVLSPSLGDDAQQQYLSSMDNGPPQIERMGASNTNQRIKTDSMAKRSEKSYPALPSSSIGADNWDVLDGVASSEEDGDGNIGSEGAEIVEYRSKSRIKMYNRCNLWQILGPLLESARNFTAVKNVSFTVHDKTNAPTDLDVLINFNDLKRLIGALIDSSLYCVNTDDILEICLFLEEYEEQPGLVMEIGLVKSQGAGRAGPTGKDVFRESLQSDILTLEEDAHEYGARLLLDDSAVAEGKRTRSGGRCVVLAALWMPILAQASHGIASA
eukprot:jgi/Picsp_1/5205/NSC_02568-R1_histidine kinase